MQDIIYAVQEFALSSGLPPEAQVFFSAMLPITELRAAIPFGITILKMAPISAFIWAVIGNIIPMLLILALMEPVCKFLMKKSKFLNKYLTKLFEKTHRKHSKKFDRYGTIFLFIFVAIPLPGSGGWTGTLLAFLFGISFWRAAIAISAGIATAGALITLITIGAVSLTNLV